MSPRADQRETEEKDLKYPGQHLISFDGESLDSAKKRFKKQTVVIDGAENQLNESDVQIQNGDDDDTDDTHGYYG